MEDCCGSKAVDRIILDWFYIKGQEFSASDEIAAKLYEKFQKQYSAEALSRLSGKNLLYSMFLCGNKSNLCYDLVHDYQNVKYFGEI